MRKAIVWGFGVLVSGLVALTPRDADACGGCFVPPESSSVVTDHRMALSLSPGQTTLYDQIRYSGDPASFAWVLPTVGQVSVGLSADTMFSALDQTTRVAILAPPRNCPPPPVCPNESRDFNAPPPQAGSAADSGVTVLAKEVVGPYETVQLRATDPGALAQWLAGNGFTIPPDVQPVISRYVAEKFDFLALKLVPGKGVRDMRPVRVTTPGASPVLPLRMVAAGTGALVGITLWVVAEGRYETQNFPQFYIPTSDLAWDWTQNRSNYVDLRKLKTDAGGGRIWELEASVAVNRAGIASAVKFPVFTGGPGPVGNGYEAIKDADGKIVKTSDEVADLDVATLFAGVGPGKERVTRIRADLAHQALDRDLTLIASKDQSAVPTLRQVTKELNQPLCPVFKGCAQVGTAPRDQAAAQQEQEVANGGGTVEGGGLACASTGHGRRTFMGDPLVLGLGFGFLALAVARKRRRN